MTLNLPNVCDEPVWYSNVNQEKRV